MISREALVHNDLIDLSFSGYPSTWINNREAPFTIRERLDRVVATPGWNNHFPKAHVYHLSTRASDHSPILLLLEGQGQNRKKTSKRFFFEVCG